jgi:hypothetical protein
VQFKLRPAWEAILARDLKLCGSKNWGSAETEQSLFLVAETSDIRTIGKLHERNPVYLPVVRIIGRKGIFANDVVLEAELYPAADRMRPLR